MRPIIEVQPTLNPVGLKTGYAVLKCARVVKTFHGNPLAPSFEDVRDAAYDYAQNLLDDLRYEAERNAS